MRKKISQLIVLVLISGLFQSCMDSFTERSYYSANITSFAFKAQDTCPGIENYVFNIDQALDTGLIFNLDSLPFGSKVDHLYPTINLQSTNGYIFFNDSLWADGDTINFSTPVIFKNTSSDGDYTHVYKINVNVHQVDPDSMIVMQASNSYPAPTGTAGNKVIWQKDVVYSFFALNTGGMSVYKSMDNGLTWSANLNADIVAEVRINSLCQFDSKFYLTTTSGQLYSSSDGLSWTATGDGTKISTLYGSLSKTLKSDSNPNYLIGLAENVNGDTCYARSSNGIDWKNSIGDKIDSDFPINEYAFTNDTTVTGVQSYTIATGLNSSGTYSSDVWTTESGTKWYNISDKINTRRSLTKRKAASIFFYEKYLVCLGGIDPNGEKIKTIYVSADKGKGWVEAPDSWASLKMVDGLVNNTVYVQHIADTVNKKDREYLWIFGGSNDSGLSTSVWKGYLNSMVFSLR